MTSDAETGDPGQDVSSTDVRRRLITAAHSCFGANGYSATSMASILRMAGVSNGSAYYVAKAGKVDLAVEVYQLLSEDLRLTSALAKPRQSDTLEEFLAVRLLPKYIGWFKSDRGRAAFMLEIEAVVPNQNVRMAINHARVELQKLICALLRSVRNPPRMKDLPPSTVEMLVLGPVRLGLVAWVTNAAGISDPATRVRHLGNAIAASLRIIDMKSN
jgi:AcrR family transcriptional regulator